MRTRTLLSLLTMTLLAVGCTEPHPADPTGPGTGAPDGAAASEATACALAVTDELALDGIAALEGFLEALLGAGTLTSGQANALGNHLRNARRHIEETRWCPARAQLEAFREQVRNFREDGILTDRDIAPLLGRARHLLDVPPPEEADMAVHAPGAVGEIRSVVIDGEELVYEVIDGLAIFTGDMILGYADEFEAAVAGGGPAAVGVCFFHHFSCERWHDATIGYDFADDWGSDSDDMRTLILSAIDHWEEHTGIRFEQRSGGERLVFRNGTGCSSHVGRKVFTGLEPQWINLNSDGCGMSRAVIIHEIGHAVGIYHEQSRDDRDAWVRINFDIIQDGRAHNFAQYGGAARDVGRYDYGSIMHYFCTAFRTPGATGNTVEPIRDGATCADIGQATELSEGDILGAYALYPPAFVITGAVPLEVRDRFELRAEFSTPPVRDDYIVWTSDAVDGVLGTGPTFSTVEAGLPNGAHLITASIVIFGTTVVERSIQIIVLNDPPAVDLGPDRDVELNRRFTLVASVTDTEDGTCPPSVCTYTWDPEPETDRGTAADFRFGSVGPRTISVTVEDGGGAIGSDEVTVTVVNSPPEPVAEVPSNGSRFSSGASIRASGYATDINEGPDPGPGLLACGSLAWESSDPSDAVSAPIGCSPLVTFGDPGPRTLTLTATDPQGLSASVEVDVTVVDCGDNCPPDIVVMLDTPPDFHASRFEPDFSGPGYHLTTPIEMTGTINDADEPPDNPVAFEWRVTAPCFPAPPCPEPTVLDAGTVVVPTGPEPATLDFTWMPGNDVDPWPDCFGTPIPYRVSLWAQDERGATNVFSRTVFLLCQLG